MADLMVCLHDFPIDSALNKLFAYSCHAQTSENPLFRPFCVGIVCYNRGLDKKWHFAARHSWCMRRCVHCLLRARRFYYFTIDKYNNTTTLIYQIKPIWALLFILLSKRNPTNNCTINIARNSRLVSRQTLYAWFALKILIIV